MAVGNCCKMAHDMLPTYKMIPVLIYSRIEELSGILMLSRYHQLSSERLFCATDEDLGIKIVQDSLINSPRLKVCCTSKTTMIWADLSDVSRFAHWSKRLMQLSNSSVFSQPISVLMKWWCQILWSAAIYSRKANKIWVHVKGIVWIWQILFQN